MGYRGTSAALLAVILLVVIAGCASMTATSPNTAIQGNLADAKVVLGNWIRSGGYRLLIRETSGGINVEYVSPSQGNVNVSQSEMSIKDNNTKIEITLSDVNYPGSYYVLIYDNNTDTLKGKYTYPRGTLDVTFMRGGSVSTPTRPTAAIPLPQDIQIVAPEPTLPPEIKLFAGKWFGVWDGILEHILVVEQINPPNATVIYAYGKAPAWNIQNPNFSRVQGQIEARILTLSLKRPATVTYRLQPDGTLDATYASSGGISHAKMKRLDQ